MTLFRNIAPGAIPCNQPVFPNSFGNSQCFHNFIPTQTCKPFPDVVGEGEIASLALPDGTVQYFFIPTVKWSAPYINSSQMFNNFSPPVDPNPGVWFVKRITNPVPSFYPPYNNYEVPPYATDYNISSPNANGLPLKFHNDKLTSTSDIHYFYPYLREYCCPTSQPPNHAACQVATTTCHYEVVCSKPCCCGQRPKPMSTSSLETKQSTVKSDSSTLTLPKDKSTKKAKDKSRKQKTKSKSKRNVIREWQTDTEQTTQTTKDKGSATSEPRKSHSGVVFERYSGSYNEKANKTQKPELQTTCDSRPCCSHRGTDIDNIFVNTREKWFPKTHLSQKALLTESEYNKRLESSSTNTTDSSCSCYTNMDLTE